MRRTLLAALVATTVLTFGGDARAQDLVGTAPGAERTEEPSAEAEEPTKPDENQPPQTQPPDLGFGEHQLSERYHFPDPKQYEARVDRRDDIDATADRTILWPTAHTPRRNRLSYSNYMLLLNQLSFSPTDDLELTGTISFADAVADFHTGLSAKITVLEGPNSIVSIQPFGFYHTELADLTELANRHFGLGTALLADFMVNNDFVFTLGAAAFATVWLGTQDFNYDGCESRQDFIDGVCRRRTTDTTLFPSGGHWLGGQAGMTWYIFDSFSLRGELMTGIAAGSVLGTDWIRDDPSAADSRARFTEGKLAVGIPYGSEVTGGAGFAWSNGLFAAQLSGYVTRAPSPFEDFEGNRPDFWVLVPMLNVSAALF